MKDTLQRTTIFLTRDQHEGLRTLAFKKRKSMSQLLREATLDVYYFFNGHRIFF